VDLTPPASPSPRRPLSLRACAAIVAALLLTVALLEHAMGRSLVSGSGTIRLWTSQPNGPETSQQLADPYSFTHLLHGLLFYAALRFLLPHLPSRTRFLLALALEAAWEVFENSPFTIHRYRANTAAVGYEGDTLLNSLGDIVSCAAGFALARVLPPWLAVALFFATELTLALTIHDNLTLSILMLLHPFPAIKHWQTQ
jgi:hypothetical protein